MNDLSAIEQWAGALLARLSPAGRRAAMRDVARELRRRQQARIAAQENPDGSAYEPRKANAGGRKLRGKRGRIKRSAMFMKLRTSRLMAVETTHRDLAIGFAGRLSRVARIHQFGAKAPVTPGGPVYHYPARLLLGFADLDREMLCEALLRHLAK